MKIFFFILGILLTASNLQVNAQSVYNADENPTTCLFFINQKGSDKDNLTGQVVFNSRRIDKLEVIYQDGMMARFGYIPASVVLDVTMKPSVKLINLTEFYNNHNVTEEQRALPVYIDSTLVDKSKSAWIYEEDVARLTILDTALVIEQKDYTLDQK